MNTSHGNGNQNATIAIVFSTPRDGQSYLDKSAFKIFTNALQKVGIDYSQLYLTSVIKNQTPLKDLIEKRQGESFSLLSKGYEIQKELKEELAQLPNLKVIIPLGNTKKSSLENLSLSIITNRWGINSKWYGSIIHNDNEFFKLPQKPYIIPNIHPAFILGDYKLRNLSVGFYSRAFNVATGKHKFTKREILIAPTFEECIDFLNWIIKEKRSAYDIETIPKTTFLSCISFSNQLKAISIPFFTLENGLLKHYFSAVEEVAIIKLVKIILESPDIKIIGQNIVFDNQVMKDRYGIIVVNYDDTMIANNILMGDYPKNLGFITTRWTDIPYHKGVAKDFLPRKSIQEKFWHYNALDSLPCDEAMPKQISLLKKQGNYEIYQIQKNLISPLVDINSRGILVNQELFKRLEREKTKEYHKLNAALVEYVNNIAIKGGYKHRFNDKFKKSPKQLGIFFNTILKAKQYKTKQKKFGFDELVLQYLARDGYEVAGKVIAVRKLEKDITTYYNSENINSKGRFASHINPAGTRTSRLSSSKSIINGSGGNSQNLPSDFKQVLIPDAEYCIYEIDLSLAEKRVTAYYANALNFINALENDICLHCVTGSDVTGIPWKEIWQQHLSGNDKNRKIGKANNFAWDYGRNYFAYSRENSIPLNIAKQHYITYHKKNPEIKANFWRSVENQLKKTSFIRNLMGRNIKFDLCPWDQATFRIGYNSIPQSTVGDIINKHGMLYIWDNRETIFSGLQMLNQIHDSLYFQIPLGLGWKRHAEMLIALKKSLEVLLKCPNGNEFTIPCDLTILPISMWKKQGEEIKAKDFSEDSGVLSRKIEKIYNDLVEEWR